MTDKLVWGHWLGLFSVFLFFQNELQSYISVATETKKNQNKSKSYHAQGFGILLHTFHSSPLLLRYLLRKIDYHSFGGYPRRHTTIIVYFE